MAAAPYDTLETILNAVRTRANDAIGSLAGDVLQDAQPFMQTYANNGWRSLQDRLATLGYATLNRECVVTGITPTAATDPAVQCWLNWSGYYNGSVLNSAITIPQDFVFPIRIWERLNGQNLPFGRTPMENATDGLFQVYGPTFPTFNYQWTWREDRIFFPGSLSTEDFRIQYARYFPDFETLSNVAITSASNTNPVNLTSVGSGIIDGESITISGATGTGWTNLNATWTANVIDDNTFSVNLDTSAYTGTMGSATVFATKDWFNRPVPIMRAQDAFTLYVLYEATAPRGDIDSASILQMADNAAAAIMNRDIRQKERVNLRRMSRSGRLEGYAGSGYY